MLFTLAERLNPSTEAEYLACLEYATHYINQLYKLAAIPNLQ